MHHGSVKSPKHERVKLLMVLLAYNEYLANHATKEPYCYPSSFLSLHKTMKRDLTLLLGLGGFYPNFGVKMICGGGDYIRSLFTFEI